MMYTLKCIKFMLRLKIQMNLMYIHMLTSLAFTDYIFKRRRKTTDELSIFPGITVPQNGKSTSSKKKKLVN